MRTLCMGLLALVVALGTMAQAMGAVTQLTGFGDFVSLNVVKQTFETTINTPEFTFEATAYRGPAWSWADSHTPSGVWGLVEDRVNEPLKATVLVPGGATETGMFFGNDDWGAFSAVLEVFNASHSSLGSVSVVANINDWADQFIGLRSDSPFSSVEIRYTRPGAQELSVYVDDFGIGWGVIPEPSTLMIWSLLGALGVSVAWWRRRRAA